MTYTKHVWKVGDTISASYLNNIENEIENRLPFKISLNYEEDNGSFRCVLNKTWQEVADAFDNNRLIIFNYNLLEDLCYNNAFSEIGNSWDGIPWEENGTYGISFYSAYPSYFTTDNPDGYPTSDWISPVA